MSPLVALFFALEGHSGAGEPAAVWAMDPWELNKWAYGTADFGNPLCPMDNASRKLEVEENVFVDLDAYLPKTLDWTRVNDELPELPLALQTPLANSRISAQQGCFTVHGSREASIDEIFKEKGGDECRILRIDIPADQCRGLSELLYLLGFKEESIYRDLDALAARIPRELT